MNKLFSILLSSLIMLQSFGVHYDDIVQLDELIEHAQFHSEQYGDNIIVFLSKHYGELKAEHQRDHQEEKKDHEKLPFNHSSTSHTCIADIFINTYKADFNLVEFLDYSAANFHYHAPTSTLHTQGILQPPRFS
ncbi:hypothetical protein SAMN04488009_1376 [Maribacter sedimenticola]|uniref:Uncharacterized protein n=1 Tax=Maribacter sedimenticola TaxID=228956 RepID=A0ABY1SEZ6_9FLAO|nr:hypothetical protein [Maribacter sedimenticola]SNR39815.1 hypothetical protein SAMN04488009_1376 [Maribacter sedimenticola]